MPLFINVRRRFKRVWVLQEYALAKLGTFMLGDTLVDSFTLCRAFQGLLGECIKGMVGTLYSRRPSRRFSHLVRQLEPAFDLIMTIPGMHLAANKYPLAGMHVGRPFTLARVLQTSVNLKATDPRDRVYALLGLTEDPDMSTFEIDYTEPVQALSKRTTSLLLQKGWYLDVMHFPNRRRTGPKSSWMIDLEQEPDKANGLDRFVISEAYHWNTGGSSRAKHSLHENDNTLSLRGLCVDMITNLSDSFPENAESGSLLDFYDVQEEPILRWGARVSYWYKTLSNKHGGIRILHEVVLAGQNPMSALPSVVAGRIPTLNQFGSTVLHLAREVCYGNRVGHTTNEGWCLVPTAARTGDVLAITLGSPTPFVLRRVEGSEARYRLIGCAYVQYGPIRDFNAPRIMRGQLTCRIYVKRLTSRVSSRPSLRPSSMACMRRARRVIREHDLLQQIESLSWTRFRPHPRAGSRVGSRMVTIRTALLDYVRANAIDIHLV
jgi:hypothetical protein